jgi:NADH-quinone oxidoreductase subunit C
MDIRTPISTNGGDWQAKFGETWKTQAARLQERFGGSIERIGLPGTDAVDVPVVFSKAQGILELLRFLKDEQGFEYAFLSDITATDEEVSPRFEVVYNLFSHTKKCRIRVKVRVEEGAEVPSAVPLWKAANWAEREIWDMFGIKFSGHPDLRRILMDERWVGHPLRKDYPLRGYQLQTTPEPAHPDFLE